MRSFVGFAIVALTFLACDDQRVYERNTDFNARHWLMTDQPELEFEISDTLQSFNLYFNVRNSLDYPFARLFVKYQLHDSTGAVLQKDLISGFLFDEKTGEPFGESGLGDIYHHRIPIKQGYQFPYAGKYRIVFEQYMRKDTLEGVLAVGLRVEKTAEAN
jgi:gliding motility-associated lipoprotein GldH